MHLMPVQLDVQVPIGATGAVGTITGPGIASVTRLAVGTYRIQLQDNYASVLGVDHKMTAPVAGASVAATAMVAATMYQITALGSTNFNSYGVPSGITPAVGVAFLATGAGTGSGTVKAIGNSGIAAVEMVGVPNTMIQNQPFQAQLGGFITIQCLGATSSSVTTLIPADPASGSTMYLKILLNNSAVQ